MLSRHVASTSVPLKAERSTRDADCFINVVVSSLPATPHNREHTILSAYKYVQAADPICQQVIQFCQEGWPEKRTQPKQLHPYWRAQHRFSVAYQLLLYGSCIVVAYSMKDNTLKKFLCWTPGLPKMPSVSKALYGGQKWLGN